MVVAEQLNGIGKRLSRVLESFIDQQRKVGLLVSPVNLEQRLEASKELLHLIECALNDVTDKVLVIDVQLVLLNPREGIEMLLVVLFPRVSDDVVPLFESVSVWLQIGMLAPSLKVLDALESLIEAEDNTVRIVFCSGCHLKPVLLNAGNDRLIF